VFLGIWLYEGLPKPVRVSFDVTPPGRTRIEDPDAKPEPVSVRFSASAAPLAGVGKDVRTGIELTPHFEGIWKWSTDQTLTFTPKSDWPVDAEFTVRLAGQALVAEQIVLNKYRFTFRTAPFVARLIDTHFYQDPVEPASKKVVATVNFSHPVDISDFPR